MGDFNKRGHVERVAEEDIFVMDRRSLKVFTKI